MGDSLRVLILNSAVKWISEAAYTHSLALALRQAGHRPVLALQAGGTLEEAARQAQLPVLALRFEGGGLGSDWTDWRRLRRALLDSPFDIVHCNRGSDHWLATAALVRLRPRPPLVRTRHVVTPVRRHLFNRWLYRHATQAVISVSHAARRSLGPLPAALGPALDRVIAPGVDSARFRPDRRSDGVRARWGAAPDSVLVGLVGRVQRVKGQRQFLEAAAEVSRLHPRTQFLMAGRANEVQVRDLRQYIVSVGLDEERVRLTGWLDDLPDVMASLDIGVVASLGSEGSSRVTLEYMASGLAVVATRVGGIPDLIEDSVTGLLCRPGDPRDMARQIEALVSDAQKRTEMGRAARCATLRYFTPQRWLEETVSVYRAVLAGTRSETLQR